MAAARAIIRAERGGALYQPRCRTAQPSQPPERDWQRSATRERSPQERVLSSVSLTTRQTSSFSMRSISPQRPRLADVVVALLHAQTGKTERGLASSAVLLRKVDSELVQNLRRRSGAGFADELSKREAGSARRSPHGTAEEPSSCCGYEAAPEAGSNDSPRVRSR